MGYRDESDSHNYIQYYYNNTVRSLIEFSRVPNLPT